MYPKTLAPVAFRSTIIQNLAATAETVPFERRAAHGIVSGGTANRQVGGGIAPEGRTGSKGIGSAGNKTKVIGSAGNNEKSQKKRIFAKYEVRRNNSGSDRAQNAEENTPVGQNTGNYNPQHTKPGAKLRPGCRPA